MLKLLRKKGVAKKILWVIAVIIILSFGFFGTAYLITDNSRANYAGKIFGKKIPFEEFNDVFQHVRIQMIMRFGDKFNEVAPFLNLETDAWDRLILLYEARKRRVQAGDEEVVQTIEQYPFFQRDGRFDALLYNDILRYVFRIPAREFEEGVRDDIKIKKLFEGETSNLTVPQEEVFNAYKRQNEKAQVSYVFLSADQFKDETPFSEDQAQKYYTDNKIEFLVPASINVDYIRLDFPKEKSAQTPSNDDQEKPEEKEIVPPEAAAAVREKAEKIFQDLLVDPDILKIAPKHNAEARSSGFFSREQPNLSLGWPYEFLNKLFELKTGEILQPFETPDAVMIAKIKEKKEAYLPPYEEAKEKVKEAVLKNEAKKIAQTKAQGYLQALRKEWDSTQDKDFPKIAKGLGLEIRQTPLFNRGQYLPQIGISKEFQEAAFQLKDTNSLSEIIETENAYCILHRDAYEAADEKAFEKEKDTFAQSLLNERRTQVFNDFLNRLRIDAKLVSYIPQNNP